MGWHWLVDALHHGKLERQWRLGVGAKVDGRERLRELEQLADRVGARGLTELL